MDTNDTNKSSNIRDREVEEAEYRLVFERERSLDNAEEVDGVWHGRPDPSVEGHQLKKLSAEQGLPGPSLSHTGVKSSRVCEDHDGQPASNSSCCTEIGSNGSNGSNSLPATKSFADLGRGIYRGTSRNSTSRELNSQAAKFCLARLWSHQPRSIDNIHGERMSRLSTQLLRQMPQTIVSLPQWKQRARIREVKWLRSANISRGSGDLEGRFWTVSGFGRLAEVLEVDARCQFISFEIIEAQIVLRSMIHKLSPPNPINNISLQKEIEHVKGIVDALTGRSVTMRPASDFHVAVFYNNRFVDARAAHIIRMIEQVIAFGLLLILERVANNGVQPAESVVNNPGHPN
ncbi:hypothetical protein CERZMDRAFT_92855 [Cercospora zeae-maydis SCOH1-5]|uniref:Uncharacterized protein n=1 Tax=Cercospora zeae-maydis SCOH1-5 TaxID=717836 RepID=A0A6A6FTG6_9PEZI|nr:hypothetical protein CERZMDRAFT_92855 [Cercospora zeae-maydis SCOH1-5]